MLERRMNMDSNNTNDLITNVFVRYHDLKCDIYVEVIFENANDMLEFFSKYNPCFIDVEFLSLYK